MTLPSIDLANMFLTANPDFTGRVFRGRIPIDIPGTLVCFFDDPGGSANPRWLRDDSPVRVVVRGAENDYPSGAEAVQKVKDFFLGKEPTTVGNVYYVRFIVRSDAGFVGFDEKNHPMFAIVFLVTRDYDANGTNRLPL